MKLTGENVVMLLNEIRKHNSRRAEIKAEIDHIIDRLDDIHETADIVDKKELFTICRFGEKYKDIQVHLGIYDIADALDLVAKEDKHDADYVRVSINYRGYEVFELIDKKEFCDYYA